jgi:amidohydrolase
LQLPATQQKILAVIGKLEGLDVKLGRSVTSIVADLGGRSPGPTILLRADMDALPITEAAEVEYASRNNGRMHACGHDAHAAMLVGAVLILVEHRAAFRGRVRFAFQPGEENDFGMCHMIDEGVLDAVDAAFSLHVAPNLPANLVGTRAGPIMAAADAFQVRITGHEGHASAPHRAKDPVPVCCEYVSALQTFVTREISPFEPAVITVTRIKAGNTTNVIPASATVEGTIRTLNKTTRRLAAAGVVRLARGLSAAHGCSAEVQVRHGYPVTVNDAEAAALVRRVSQDIVGERNVYEMPAPVMGADDFAHVLERVPGAMSLLGACPSDIENPSVGPSVHSSLMRLNEDALATGTALHVATALQYLGAAA